MNREPKIGIIIQTRLGSTRFPEKVLKPFGNDTILAFLIKRLEQIGLPIVVATTTTSKDDKLVSPPYKAHTLYLPPKSLGW